MGRDPGQEALGNRPLHRAYQARDGWFFIGAKESDLPLLSGVAGLAGIESLRDEALEQSLEERFLGDDRSTWVDRLTGAGIGAHRVVMDLEELMRDPWVVSHGLSLTREHDEIGLVTTCGPAPRLSRTPVSPGKPAAKPGSDARNILEQHGLGSEYDRLVSSGVILIDGVAAG